LRACNSVQSRLNSLLEARKLGGTAMTKKPEGDTAKTKKTEGGSTKLTLGKYLAFIRDDRGMTLRQVEESTKISNAYLSQIENDKIKQPSPNKLYSLAELYDIDYEELMERAGHITSSKKRAQWQTHGRAATFADCNLTEEEEAELLRYLKYIRDK